MRIENQDKTKSPSGGLYKIMCNPMHPLYGAQPVPNVPVRATRSALVAHRCTCVPPHCLTSQNRKTFIPFSVSLWNDPVDRWCGTGGFHEQGHYFFIGLSCSLHFCLLRFPFLLVLSKGWYCGAWVFRLIGCKSPSISQPFMPTSINNNFSIYSIIHTYIFNKNIMY